MKPITTVESEFGRGAGAIIRFICGGDRLGQFYPLSLVSCPALLLTTSSLAGTPSPGPPPDEVHRDGGPPSPLGGRGAKEQGSIVKN